MQYQQLKCIFTFPGDSDAVESIDISSDGQTLVSGSWSDGTIKIWNLLTKELKQTLAGHELAVSAVKISPNQQIIASGSRDETVKLWDLNTGNLKHTLKTYGEEVDKEIACVLFSLDSQNIYTATEGGSTYFWDVNTGQKLGNLGIMSTGCSHLDISWDGGTIAGIYLDNLYIFDPPRKKRSAITTGFNNCSVAVSPNGETIYISDNKGKIHLWNSQTAQRTVTLTGHLGRVRKITISPNKQILASGDEDGIIKLWDLNSQTELCSFTAHSADITGLVFTPDSQNIISSGDTTIKVWESKTI
ncbi:MAG TPA: WD40 repeat domain-containing protein [Nostocaceae cyanobacterium]|nr:WD40 repeat domain-containing protein [Nostocaceae cyanobacterium]